MNSLQKMVPLILNALNLQKLLNEIFKVIMKLALETLDEVSDIMECPYPHGLLLLARRYGVIYPVN